MLLVVKLVACAPIAESEPPAAVPAVLTWPIPMFDEPKTTVADLDGDGVVDTQIESRSMGSGWHGFADCVRDEAAAFPGSQTWSEGSTDGTWTVYWSPRGAVTWQPSASSGLQRVATAGPLEVWQQGHALAVYDPAKDRHAWIASWAELSDGFKVDRWERISSVAGSPGEVRAEVASLEGTETVSIKLKP